MEPTTQTPTNTPVPAEPAALPQNNTPVPNEAPVETPAPAETPEQPQTLTTQPPATTPQETTQAPPAEVPVEEEEEYPTYQQIPGVPPIDFSQLPVDENNLIDPNALASQINQRIAMAEQNAQARAQQIYNENDAEKRSWDKAYEKYPELKENKELRDMVHNARLGRVTELLSQTNDPTQIKLPTPSQMADTLFKYTSAKKEEGFNQAQQNTVVQKSGVLETASRTGNPEAEGLDSAMKNINNPNKEVATQARNALLRKKLGWDQ